MNLGFSEMIFIFLLALIIFGPKKLPEIGRQIGKALAEFKRASNEFKSQLETEMRQIEIADALKKEKESLDQVLHDPATAIANRLMPPEGSVASASLDPRAESAAAAAGPDGGGAIPVTEPDKSSDTGKESNA